MTYQSFAKVDALVIILCVCFADPFAILSVGESLLVAMELSCAGEDFGDCGWDLGSRTVDVEGYGELGFVVCCPFDILVGSLGGDFVQNVLEGLGAYLDDLGWWLVHYCIWK